MNGRQKSMFASFTIVVILSIGMGNVASSQLEYDAVMRMNTIHQQTMQNFSSFHDSHPEVVANEAKLTHLLLVDDK